MIEAESRAVAKAAVSRKGQPHVMDRDAKAVEITEELDVLCMRYTGCHFTDLAFRGKILIQLLIICSVFTSYLLGVIMGK